MISDSSDGLAMLDLLLGYLVVGSSGVSKLPQIRAVASTGAIKAWWNTLIGRGQSTHCALIG